MDKINLNETVIIYPTDKGWEKINRILRHQCQNHGIDFSHYISSRVTNDGGYKDQLWQLINDIGVMFFPGPNYFKDDYFYFVREGEND